VSNRFDVEALPAEQRRRLASALDNYRGFASAFTQEGVDAIFDAVWHANPMAKVPVGLRLRAKAAGDFGHALLWGWGVDFLIQHARDEGNITAAIDMELLFNEVTEALEELVTRITDLLPSPPPGPLAPGEWVPVQRAAKYGITPTDGLERLADQGFACAVCLVPFDSPSSVRFDHNHATGAFRGFLCGACNTGLGFLRDNPRIIAAALDYLNDRGHYGIDPQENT